MPRSPLFGEPAKNAIVVRVTSSQKRDLQVVAQQNNSDVASVIRDAVNDYVADYRERLPVFRIPKPRRG